MNIEKKVEEKFDGSNVFWQVITSHLTPETVRFIRDDYMSICKEAYEQGAYDGATTERRFILNVLDGVDMAEREMGETYGRTLAIRHALKSRVIHDPTISKNEDV